MPPSLLQVLNILRTTDLKLVKKMFSRLAPQDKDLIKAMLSTLPWLADWHGQRAVNPNIVDIDIWGDEEMVLLAEPRMRRFGMLVLAATSKRRCEACAAEVRHHCSAP
jgi:hypothetical protein